MVNRECLLEELKAASAPLAESCTEEVSAKVEAAVTEAVAAWTDTCTNLRELCNKYHHAADLWKQYKDASDLVKEWLDNGIETADDHIMEPEEALKTVKVRENCFFLYRN